MPIIHTLFSNLKAWPVGTHHGVSTKHLPRYLREWSYPFNPRNLPDALDRYVIRRTVKCATITYAQLKLIEAVAPLLLEMCGTRLPAGRQRPA